MIGMEAAMCGKTDDEAPGTIHVYAPEGIVEIKIVRQADDTDEDHAARQNMYAKLLKLNDEVPEALARALDASAEDLREGRILDDFDGFIDEMEAELADQLDRVQALVEGVEFDIDAPLDNADEL
jgi:soluble cytochrome b562